RFRSGRRGVRTPREGREPRQGPPGSLTAGFLTVGFWTVGFLTVGFWTAGFLDGRVLDGRRGPRRGARIPGAAVGRSPAQDPAPTRYARNTGGLVPSSLPVHVRGERTVSGTRAARHTARRVRRRLGERT